jgi:hypothetical protein
MFINTQLEQNTEKYIEILKSLGALSKLFSDSDIPYLYYRTAENAFCLAFGAENLARSDTSVDARKDKVGIGLKTFLNSKSGESFQKVAEFNKARTLYAKHLDQPLELTQVISDLRNKRLQVTKDIHGLESIIYHSVIRDRGKFYIAEEPMPFIDIEKIKNAQKGGGNSIFFEDNSAEYLFNISKSTLYKRFYNQHQVDFDVKVFDNPFELLEALYNKNISLLEVRAGKYRGIVYLPLYSTRGERIVPERSGLNQWNAGGRERGEKEVYIPIPAWIHQKFEGFFPKRDSSFNLKLPNGKILNTKVCQEGGKALMSNPNSALGEWLLDEVLKVSSGEIVTMDMLDGLGIDSVEIRKRDDKNFEIDFKKTGTYEKFLKKYV